MTIRVLVVDDSAFMRKVLSDILNSDPDIKVIAKARDGQDAIEKVEALHPDVITLDNVMPVLNGLDTLGYIMSECPTPVVMLTATGRENADTTLTAFEYGAVDFIEKPSGQISLDINNLKEEILQKVKAAAHVDVRKLNFIHKKTTTKPRPPPTQKISNNGHKKIVAISSSTGGPRALEQVIPNLPADLNVPVLVVQHMPAGFTKSLAERLDAHSKLKVKEASEGDIIRSGLVLIAPGGYHMEIEKQNGAEIVKLNKKPKQNGVRPSADVMYNSILPIWGKNIISVILTGMGRDGAEGIHEIKKAGGKTIAEDKSTCVVYGMPKSVVEKGDADIIAPIHEIAEKITTLVKERW